MKPSDERWITIAESDLRGRPEDEVFMKVAHRHEFAKGQRVGSIRWCETHGNQALGTDHYCEVACVNTLTGATRCRIVDATLILPPKAQA